MPLVQDQSSFRRAPEAFLPAILETRQTRRPDMSFHTDTTTQEQKNLLVNPLQGVEDVP